MFHELDIVLENLPPRLVHLPEYIDHEADLGRREKAQGPGRSLSIVRSYGVNKSMCPLAPLPQRNPYPLSGFRTGKYSKWAWNGGVPFLTHVSSFLQFERIIRAPRHLWRLRRTLQGLGGALTVEDTLEAQFLCGFHQTFQNKILWLALTWGSAGTLR